jgi:hypothetical protein
MKSSDALELLTIDEYAERIKIGRTTVFKWKQDGTLVPGRHYIKKGKILRFIWTRDVIEEIHQESEQTVKHPKKGVKTPKKMSPRANDKCTMNLDY